MALIRRWRKGLKLSGGERQRIAIARAIYSDRQFLFLDEASSALDDATERDIMDHILTLTDDVTVVEITHRRSIIAAGDYGGGAFQRTHDALMTDVSFGYTCRDTAIET